MLAGWLAQGVSPAEVVVVEPRKPEALPVGARWFATGDQLPTDLEASVVVLAVKPQMMPDVVPAYARFSRAVFLSIAAGRTIAFFQAALGANAAIIRAMPNTPASVGRGMSVLCAGKGVSDDAKARAERLLAAVGSVAWVDDEALMDVVTAVSGSGPAYVFWLVEALAAAGEQNGLSAAIAQQLARQTVAGAGEMLHSLTESAEQLRRNVTSPGGTTAAALAVLMEETSGFKPLLDAAVAAATHRSTELAG
jgi:pyrroline-5-carboxylate reductase